MKYPPPLLAVMPVGDDPRGRGPGAADRNKVHRKAQAQGELKAVVGRIDFFCEYVPKLASRRTMLESKSGRLKKDTNENTHKIKKNKQIKNKKKRKTRHGPVKEHILTNNEHTKHNIDKTQLLQ